MNVDTVLLPRDLKPQHITARNVVVFDVLRATTTMTAALATGVTEIRVFGDIDSAAAAANAFGQGRILCGEHACLAPPGFDLGNSPGGFESSHAGRITFMSTTNGTRAIVASLGASAIFAGALVNATAVAEAIVAQGGDVTLLCAGTGGEFALEDLLGAGAVLDGLMGIHRDVHPLGDTSFLAHRLFQSCRHTLELALTESTGGKNVIAAGLAPDITFAARLNALNVVGVIDRPAIGETPVLRTFVG